MRIPRRLLLIVAASSAIAGCAVFASRSDYADYRAVRTASDDRATALAMARYASAHPDGSWIDEVQEKRRRAEPMIFDATKSTRDGLAFYLEAYPDGQYSAQAQQRLEALNKVAGRRSDEEEAQREVHEEQREEASEARRTWATRAVTFWTKTLLSIQNWGSPLGDVATSNAEFNRAFGQNPRPRCSREECVKFYSIQFAVPVPGRTRIERVFEMLLRLRLENGNLVRAEMLLPDRGFSRWFELENRAFVADADPQARDEAIEFAVTRILPAIREIFADAQTVDTIVDPIEPPRIRPPNQPDQGAGLLPGETPSEEPVEDPPTEGDEPVAIDEGPAEMFIPIAIQGYSAGPLRIVVFAASPDEEGRAYDGIFIELATPDAESAE